MERLRAMIAELDGLARDGKLTFTRYLTLRVDAAQAAEGKASWVPRITAYVERVQPDFDKLCEIHLELERLGRDGALTPLRYDALVEQARGAVGPNGPRFVDAILEIGLERDFMDAITRDERGKPGCDAP
jgi:hypothetical protein